MEKFPLIEGRKTYGKAPAEVKTWDAEKVKAMIDEMEELREDVEKDLLLDGPFFNSQNKLMRPYQILRYKDIGKDLPVLIHAESAHQAAEKFTGERCIQLADIGKFVMDDFPSTMKERMIFMNSVLLIIDHTVVKVRHFIYGEGLKKALQTNRVADK